MLPKPRKSIPLEWQPKWENLTDEQRSAFLHLMIGCYNSIRNIVPLIDVQLVGSRAFGNCEPNSDYDVNFVSASNEIVPMPAEAVTAIKQTKSILGFDINAGIGPDARSLVCFSFKDNKFYGKEWGEALNKASRFNSARGCFEVFDV